MALRRRTQRRRWQIGAIESLARDGRAGLGNPGRVSFKTDDFGSETLAQLLRFDSLREEVKGATIAFRHDVLRDWTVGFLLHEDSDLLKTLPVSKPLLPGLARGVEIAARLAIEDDLTGERWLVVLDAVRGDGSHGSWRRPVLLALPRAEQSCALFESLKSVLLADDGRLLREIILLMIAVKSVPIAKVIERVQPSIKVPSGVSDMIVPKGIGWMWLVLWLVSTAKSLPTALIPEVSKVFQAWLISTQHQSFGLNPRSSDFSSSGWHSSRTAMTARYFRDMRDAPPNLNIHHPRDVRNEIRMTAFAFAHVNPTAAQNYTFET